jgi:hypothetical protein
MENVTLSLLYTQIQQLKHRIIDTTILQWGARATGIAPIMELVASPGIGTKGCVCPTQSSTPWGSGLTRK